MHLETLRINDLKWQPSPYAKAWEFAPLNGFDTHPIGQRCTIRCRIKAGGFCSPCLSDDTIEWIVLSGSLVVNGTTLEVGDSAVVLAGLECTAKSTEGAEAICVMHGSVIRAEEILSFLRSRNLSEADAGLLLRLPWIDHIRRYVGVTEIPLLAEMIHNAPSESVRELCVGLARDLQDAQIQERVENLLENPLNTSMRIRILTYLASKGRISEEEWRQQLAALSKSPNELLSVLQNLYAVTELSELRLAIERRIASGEYGYNRHLYDLVLRLISEPTIGIGMTLR